MMLKKYDKEKCPIGEGSSDAVCVHRVKLAIALLKTGMPIAKLGCSQDLFS